MKLSPHLIFNGDCESAFVMYQRLLKGTITLMKTYGDSPAATQVPADWHNKIVHAVLNVAGLELLGADVTTADYSPPQGFLLAIDLDDFQSGELVFNELAAGGIVNMPFQETFWSLGYGVVVDRFGIPWEINCKASPGKSDNL